jgi:RND superfamily putative drug exporter
MRGKGGIAGRAGHWSATHPKTAIAIWIAFVVIAVMGGSAVGQREITDSEELVRDSSVAAKAIEDRGPAEVVEESFLIESETAEVGDPGFDAVIADVERRVAALPRVSAVQSPSDEPALVSEDRRAALVNYEIPGESEDVDGESLVVAGEAAQRAHPGYRIAATGEASGEFQLDGAIEEDMVQAEVLSLPVTFLILVIAFGALVAAGIPVMLAISAVIAAIGLIAIPSQIFPVNDALGSVVLLIGMAVGVDYSLFYIRRERQERARGLAPSAALDVAARTSGRAVLISGLTVIAAMSGMLLSGNAIFISFGVGTMMVVGVAMLGSITVLPAALSLLGDRIEKGRLPLLSRIGGGRGDSHLWGAVVGAVMRRPALSLLAAGGILIALAVPAFNMDTKVTAIEDAPSELSTIAAYERIQDEFASESPPAEIAIETRSPRGPKVETAVERLTESATEAGVAVAPPSIEYGRDLAVVSMPLAGSGDDDESKRALAELREDLIPAAFAGTGAEVNVTGMTAETVDFEELLAERLPLVIGFVLALAFILMLVTFRSVTIPIVSIALNLLSVGAAYGVLVLVFQEGIGQGLLGAESETIVNWLPLFMFVILFGLSMDYHVFILSRIKELVDGGTPTDEAVERGIRSTAGTVTAAAVVMVAVFAIFGSLTFIDMKQMGVGLATAVLIDATVIRGVMLPATLKLLGDRSWYLPSWLGWLPRGRRAPAPAVATETA